jgi:large subunit ribosomal protein L19
MNIIKQFEAEQVAILTQGKNIPKFNSGDSVKVNVRIVDGANERIQAYEGVVIAKSNRGISSSFVVRKISHGVGVERRFMIYSPMIQDIIVVKHGVVRRAKLYYLRERSGKSARIKEKIRSA